MSSKTKLADFAERVGLSKPKPKRAPNIEVLRQNYEAFKSVNGWLTVTDQTAMSWILEWQNTNEKEGDLVELGVFEGKSAIYIGSYMKGHETFTVCDLFEEAATETAIAAPIRHAYATLSQQKFEDNYKIFHETLPEIVRGLSTSIMKHVKPGTCRFLHIDASHQYEHVREDTVSARALLRENGVVVFDDFRTEHTPGTSAATWEAVINDGLKPICLTQSKFYATWGDPLPLQRYIIAEAKKTPSYKTSLINMPHGLKVVRLFWQK
jgi:predicted O-methyltransferase YrrM